MRQPPTGPHALGNNCTRTGRSPPAAEECLTLAGITESKCSLMIWLNSKGEFRVSDCLSLKKEAGEHTVFKYNLCIR